MSRDPELLLEDIVERCQAIDRIAGSLSEAEFVGNEIVYEGFYATFQSLAKPLKDLPRKSEIRNHKSIGVRLHG